MAMAKILFLSATVLLFGIDPITGQDIANQVYTNTTQSAPSWPVQVEQFEVSIVSMVRVSAVGGSMPTAGNPSLATASSDSGRLDDQKIIFALKTKNPGDKAINAIHWEARFIDANKKAVTKQFKTKKKIDAGKDKTIEESTLYDGRLIPETVRVAFRIMKIEYSDKSVWEECLKDTESCFVYKTITFK